MPFGVRTPVSPVFPDPLTPPFDPLAQPPMADQFGPLSTALGDPEMMDPVAYGYREGPGRSQGLLAMLKELLSALGTGGRPSTFTAEMPSKPWGIRYDTPSTRNFGGGSVRSGSARGFSDESGRQG